MLGGQSHQLMFLSDAIYSNTMLRSTWTTEKPATLPFTAGYNDVLDDEVMGWARYAHSMRVFVLNSGLFYIRPTLASLDLLDRIAFRLDTENGWDQAIFNEVSQHHICLRQTCLRLPCQCIPGMLVTSAACIGMRELQGMLSVGCFAQLMTACRCSLLHQSLRHAAELVAAGYIFPFTW